MTRRIVRAVLVTLLAAGASAEVVAQRPTYLTVSAYSYHFDRSREYNEANSGAGVEHFVNDQLVLMAGFYRNSRPGGEETSTYGGLAYLPLAFGPIRAGVMLGAVTGYKAAPVLPAAGGIVSIGGRDSGVNIHLLPSARNRTLLGTVGFQLKRAF
jgi:hypothetical protein